MSRKTLSRRFPGYVEVDGRCLRKEMESVFRQRPEFSDLRNQWSARWVEDAIEVSLSSEVECDQRLSLRFSVTDGHWLGQEVAPRD